MADGGDLNENGSFGMGSFDESDDDDDDFIYEDELEGSSDFDKDEEYEVGENMYEDKGSQRRTRSLTSSHGAPIVEESYALKRNRTNPRVDDSISRLLLNKGRPTMRYDWNDGRTPSPYNQPSYHHNSFPKKYQEQRAPPTEYVQSPRRHHASRTLNEYNSRQYGNQHLNQQAAPTHEVKTKAFQRIVKKNEFERLRKTRTLENVENINTGVNHRSGRGRSANQKSVKSIAIHLSGDTSKFVHGHHENYDGNGRLRHIGGTYTDWEASPWVNILAMDRFFKLDKGVVTIQENGLYYIYAQIFYHDDHDTNGFVVHHNTQRFLQCTTMTHSQSRVTKSNTCFTSGVAYMRNGDTVYLSDLGNHRYTLFEPSKSFFGLIKMGDARPLHETLA